MDWGQYRSNLLTEITRVAEAGGLKVNPTWDPSSLRVEVRDPDLGKAHFTVQVALQGGAVVAGLFRDGERPVPGRPGPTEDRSFWGRDIHAKFPPGLLFAVENEVAAHANDNRAGKASEASVEALGAAIQDLVVRNPGGAGEAVADLVGRMLPGPAVDRLTAAVEAMPGHPGPLMGRMAALGHADGAGDASRQIGIRPGGPTADIAGGTWQIVDDRGGVFKAVPRSVVQRRPPETLGALLNGARAVYAEGRAEGAMDRSAAPAPDAAADIEEAALPAFR